MTMLANPRTDGKKVFTLKERNRSEILSPVQARVRNQNRKHASYPGQWTEDSNPTNVIVEPRTPLSKMEWQHAFSEGLRKDFETAAARAKLAQETIVAKNATATAEKTETETGEVTTRPRQEYKGIGMCALIRYCGHKGYDAAKTTAVLAAVGLTPGKATIHIQGKKGKDGDNVPTLSKELAEELKVIAGEIPAKEKAAPKAKKAAKPAAPAADAEEGAEAEEAPKPVAKKVTKKAAPKPAAPAEDDAE